MPSVGERVMDAVVVHLVLVDLNLNLVNLVVLDQMFGHNLDLAGHIRNS